jgi:hypothetical protein
MKEFNVSFFNTSGQNLGAIRVSAQTASKAKILASTLYVCSWVTQTAEAV